MKTPKYPRKPSILENTSPILENNSPKELGLADHDLQLQPTSPFASSIPSQTASLVLASACFEIYQYEDLHDLSPLLENLEFSSFQMVDKKMLRLIVTELNGRFRPKDTYHLLKN